MIRRYQARFLVIAFMIFAGFSVPAYSENTLDRVQERGELILGTSGNMPSMSQADSAGMVTGFDIDIARYMAQSMEVKLVTEVMPFSELLTALESGKVDVVISNVTITPMRNLKVAFVGPYMTSGKCFITKDETLAKPEEAESFNTPETKLAALKGSTSEDVISKIYPRATLLTFESYADGIDKVKNDEAKGMLADYPICAATLQAHPDAGFASVLTLITYEPIGIALPADDSQFINWTGNFMNRMNGTGILQGLSEKWFGTFAESKE